MTQTTMRVIESELYLFILLVLHYMSCDIVYFYLQFKFPACISTNFYKKR